MRASSWRPVLPGPGDATGQVEGQVQSLRLNGCAELRCSEGYVHIRLSRAHCVLSSAVLNGGVYQAMDFINLKVDRDACADMPPDRTIAQAASELGCSDRTVGMMTAASMKSLRVVRGDTLSGSLCAVVTTGLENARRAGDPADYAPLDRAGPAPGTINLVVVLGFGVSVATMAEMMTVAVEAKAAAMQELGVLSPASGKIATGTGTDAIAVLAPGQSDALVYAGKHTPLGEMLANLVITATMDSVGSWRDQ